MKRLLIPISRLDRFIVRKVTDSVSSRTVATASTVGWLCDARVLLTIGTVWWAVERGRGQSRRLAVRFTTTILTTTALHHAIKRMIAQPRPDRGARNPSALRTGRPFDAMPSGHAMHAGAIASLISTELPPSKGVWMAAALMAATRIVTLAHWPSGVLVGFTLGAVAAMCT